MPHTSLTAELAERFARIPLGCIQREYPNQVAHVFAHATDSGTPRQWHPAFYGCYDWHSAVHAHWCLVRLLRCAAPAEWSSAARRVLHEHLTADHLAAEAAYLRGPGRAGFERPYGLAWLLQLATELQEWNDPQAAEWLAHLAPLTALAVERWTEWLPKLTHPIRSGEHSQTAFALGLALDYARSCGAAAFERLLASRSLDFYADDAGWPLRFEPSGHDFLSPGLAEADLLRRLLRPEEFSAWLARFLPELPTDAEGTWLAPVACADFEDGKLTHVNGLNLSRAWMLEGMAAGLPAGDSRMAVLQEAAVEHARAGLAAVSSEHYAGAHWLATFAVYLCTRRGIA